MNEDEAKADIIKRVGHLDYEKIKDSGLSFYDKLENLIKEHIELWNPVFDKPQSSIEYRVVMTIMLERATNEAYKSLELLNALNKMRKVLGGESDIEKKDLN